MTERQERNDEVWQVYAIQKFFETANVQKPWGRLAIDKTISAYSARIEIKQWNPSKPAKYDILYIHKILFYPFRTPTFSYCIAGSQTG